MRATHRKAILLTMLASVVALVVWDPADRQGFTSAPSSASPESPGEQRRRAEGPGNASEQVALTTALPERPALGEPRSMLFGPQSWQPPAPRIAPAPVVPQAPPMPYRFAGRLVQDGTTQIFLSRDHTPIAIQEDQILDDTYRVESIGEDRVTLVYLPLGQKETIPLRSAVTTAGAEELPRAAAPASAPAGRLGAISSGAVLSREPPGVSPSQQGSTKPGRLELRAESDSVRVVWDGPREVKLGTNFSVALRVVSGQAVRVSPMQVRFDPAVLEPVAVRLGKFYGEQSGQGFSYRLNPDGVIFIEGSPQAVAPSPDTELLVLTFKPIRPAASTALSVASLNLEGPAGRSIALDQVAAFEAVVTR
jgi:hypothetical protein